MRIKKLPIVMIIVGLIYCVMAFIAKKTQEDESINDDNPYNYPYKPKEEKKLPLYVTTVKPFLAHVLSFCALMILSPVYALIAIAIKIDDPGPVFFAQKRVGKNNGYFMCHKFRTMKVSEFSKKQGVRTIFYALFQLLFYTTCNTGTSYNKKHTFTEKRWC